MFVTAVTAVTQEESGQAADVWSLGCCVLAMGTLSTPIGTRYLSLSLHLSLNIYFFLNLRLHVFPYLCVSVSVSFSVSLSLSPFLSLSPHPHPSLPPSLPKHNGAFVRRVGRAQSARSKRAHFQPVAGSCGGRPRGGGAG